MKREIKFRAWLGDRMEYGVVPFQWDHCLSRMSHKCIESNGKGMLGSGGTEAKFEVSGFSLANGGELMQYTGLKDKNGKEIYEGDILRHRDMYNSKVVYREAVCAFQFSYPNVDDHWVTQTLYEHLTEEYEVIGNIFENPDLL